MENVNKNLEKVLIFLSCPLLDKPAMDASYWNEESPGRYFEILSKSLKQDWKMVSISAAAAFACNICSLRERRVTLSTEVL